MILSGDIDYRFIETSITDRASGESFIKGLFDNDILFHFDDDPQDMLESFEPDAALLFTSAQAATLRDRVAELYKLNWGRHDCPIGFALTLIGE